MTVTPNDDPEIVLGGNNREYPEASAPPATGSATGLRLPTAIATPVVATAPPPTAPPQQPAATTSSGGNIERTTNDDGSLAVKITNTTTQPNGYREMKIEYFFIPASMVSTVELSLDAGIPPSNLYLTKMEQQTLPPGTGPAMSRPPSAYPTPGETTGSGPQYTQVHETPGGGSCGRSCALCVGVACTVIIALAIAGGASSQTHSSHRSPSYHRYTPAPYSHWYPPPSPWYPPPPSPWSPSTPRPTYTWENPTWRYTPLPSRSPIVPLPPSTSPSPTSSSRPTPTPRPTYFFENPTWGHPSSSSVGNNDLVDSTPPKGSSVTPERLANNVRSDSMENNKSGDLETANALDDGDDDSSLEKGGERNKDLIIAKVA
eukprot:CAMPEP_0183745388 /NCGR_PEP_ID=MMETSP0737-20130205/66216_1 /TAXON_ID=385413 /ORGANISM="Thalassiosira miniscula, Strain CCMP1093" /LENGTH=373 /DNA_ID=CAMNT_0025981051 /DNA_START=63 /DNA_END=1184 /DNA_ORIENTATION=-